MTTLQYEVRYVTGMTYTVLGSVQSFTINKGRVQIQDPFRAGTATIEGRNPSALPTVAIGDRVEIVETTYGSGTEITIFRGVVADYGVNYGMVTQADRWFIRCEDGLATAGRALTSPTGGWAAGTLAESAAINVSAAAGVTVISALPFTTTTTVSAQSVPNTNLLNVLNQLAFTDQARLTSTSYDTVLYVNRDGIGSSPATAVFTDGTMVSALFPLAFDEVVFRSQADSYFDQVVIEPEGLAAQSSGTGDRVFTGQSYDETTTQAGNLADYVLATLVVQDAVPSTISCISEDQPNVDNLLELFVGAGQCAQYQPIILRGSSYQTLIEGATLTANPDQTRFTFNLVSAEAQNFFILDSAISGVLDSSRLGF